MISVVSREGGSSPLQSPRYTATFRDQLFEIKSARMLEQIQEAVHSLNRFPYLGGRPRESILGRYGDDVRMLSVAPYLIIYRPEKNGVLLLALVHGHSVT